MPTSKKHKVRLSDSVLSVFFENLSLLTKSGLPAHQCISLMQEDGQDHELSAVLDQLASDLNQHPYLWESMEKTGQFPDYAVRMIEIGESSGNLETVSASLSRYYHRENQLKAQIRSAVLNPFILICIMCIVIVFLMVKVLPIFENVYGQFGIVMSENTMVGAALVIGQVAMWVIIALLAVIIVGFILSMTVKGRRFFARFFARFPLTRKSSYLMDITRFTSALSLQLASGVDAQTAFRLSMNTTQNPDVQQKLALCMKDIENGESIEDSLFRHQVYKSSCASMLMSGRKAGSTEKVLERISEMYEEEGSQSMDNLLSVIEPVLIGFLSVIIGVILICIMFPLIGLMSSIG